MPDWMPLGRSQGGVDWWMRDDGQKAEFRAQQDVTDILDWNKAAANHNDGYNGERDMKRAASIPHIVIQIWRNEYGVDFYNPDHWPKVKQMLNSSDWRHLRTAGGRL